MKNEKYYLNKEHFEKELERHKGKTHSKITYKGHHARLDRQCDVAYIIGVSPPIISNGFTKGIALDHLLRLSKLFGCDWEYLCDPDRTYRNEQDRIEKATQNRQDAINSFLAAWNTPVESGIEIEKGNVNGKTSYMKVSCNRRISVQELIAEIARHGGYELILEGLKGLAADIRTY